MSDYLLNFFQHWGQIDSFLASAAVWVGFFSIGHFFLGHSKHYEFAPFYGWAIVNLIFTVLGVCTSIPFSLIAEVIWYASVFALIVILIRKQRLFPSGSVRMLLLFAPLLVLVSAMVGSQWDEFSDWLITPRLLIETSSFPTSADAQRSGSLAAYPYGWHYISFLASLLAGRFLENAGALVNVFMLLTFSFLSIRLIRAGLAHTKDTLTPGWILCAIAGLSTTLLNTTFVQKVTITSYADFATAVIAGLGTIVGWYMLAALVEKDHKSVLHSSVQVGLLMMLLVNLKQSTIVLAVLVIFGIFLAGLRDPKINLRALLGTLPAMVIPSIMIFVLWRYYVVTELTAREMNMASFTRWNIEIIPQILLKMLEVLTKKGAYLFMFIIIIAFGAKAILRCRTPFDRLAIIAATVFLGHNAFLFFAYISTFSKYDALRAASYWRYNMQLGMIGVAFSTYGLGVLWQKYGILQLWVKKVAWLPVCVMILSPFVFANKLRFDRHPPVPYFRNVAIDLSKILVKGNRLQVLDPKGSGESGVITRYELGQKVGIFKGFMSAFYKWDKKKLQALVYDQKLTHLLIHTLNPVLIDVLPVKMEENNSYLLKADDMGRWNIIKTWKRK
jgi:hypothetical protein